MLSVVDISPYKLLPVTMYTQTDALNEVKDMSKNLVSGEFEREYRDGMLEKPQRPRRLCMTVLLVIIGVMAAWLVALTAVHELQLSKLRQDVDAMSADMIALKMSIGSLNQKLLNPKISPIEDTIYADIDSDFTIPVISQKSSTSNKDESLGKLDDLTVLEGEEDITDDEDYDDDDAESGDWYPDYDRRSEKIGKTDMIRLKPEDFVEPLVKLRADARPLWQVKKMLNEDPENPAVFEAAKKELELQRIREKRNAPADSSSFVDEFAAPRDIVKVDNRRKIKKYRTPSASADMPLAVKILAPRYPARIARNSGDGGENDQRRLFIAAHFHGNTSHLNTEVHERYKGNGLIRVSHDSPHDVWYPSQWTSASPHPRPTLTRSGHIRVHHTGIYLVYVQIYYLDSHDIISWVLHRTNSETEGRDTLLQCTQYSPNHTYQDRPNSCFSASALLLKAGDRLVVRNTGGDRHSLMQPEKSFIGLVKLADAEEPEEEQF